MYDIDFSYITNMDELKKAYRKLAIRLHPDAPTGSERAMKDLNTAYDAAVERIAAASGAPNTAARQSKEAAIWRATLQALLRLAGLEVELCGRWLWITGDTYRHRAALKALGCRWSGTKKAWYWHAPDEGATCHSRRVDMGAIRAKYGSIVYTADHSSMQAI